MSGVGNKTDFDSNQKTIRDVCESFNIRTSFEGILHSWRIQKIWLTTPHCIWKTMSISGQV